MSDFGRTLPRERMDALNGWKPLVDPAAEDGLLPEGDVLHLASAVQGADGLVFAQPIPDTDPAGSWGGRSLPRGVAVSGQGDLYLADRAGSRVLYTRASLPPVLEPGSDVAPFVPLWHFADDPGGEHPLNLVAPVDLTLVPPAAQPGAFADTLVIADAGRDLLVWVDRRQIVTRHTLGLPWTPRAVAALPCGRVAVLGPGQVVICERGAPAFWVEVAEDAHSIVALTDGRALFVGPAGVVQIGRKGRVGPLDAAAGATPVSPAMTVSGEVLHLPGHCADMDALAFADIPLNRLGRLDGTQLMLATRPRRLPRPRSGTWISQRFDGGAKGFAWDRVALEAVLPAQCRLLLSTFVSDIDYDPDEVGTLAVWSGPTVLDPGTPTEFLVQRNKGRYLWLKIEAFGDGTATPAISGIDLFGPRDSQLNLLPAPFHQDPLSADFLDRFLSLQDAFLGEALLIFNRVGAILTPDATPDDFIDWLGSWFDWRFLSGWDTATRREMIAQSLTFFAERGTLCGLERLLRWHTGLVATPFFLEDFRLAEGEHATVWVGGQEVPLTDAGAHRFTIVLPQSAVPNAAARDAIARLIAAQKPAHTQFRLIVSEPGVVPGQRARLGVDAVLPDSRPPPLGEGRLDTGLQTVASC
ncbi:MAG: hypothetical protein GVY31_11835 [Alphaproteobacteria bacterium]|jgi:phage tail-like protein|nr:hypothetical protein [Alphaproteobacteria bacterium]